MLLRKPVIEIKRSALEDCILSICSNPPETGGIFLGPVDADHIITDFFFDKGANCSGATYSPDHITLSKKMKDDWIPAGVDMKGFCHSHPNFFDKLSPGDLHYISRLLQINSEMSMFVSPIIIPQQFRIVPFVVLRKNLLEPKIAKVVFF